jgi:hypothetical protein
MNRRERGGGTARWHAGSGQRGIAEPAFPDDDGMIDPRLAQVLGDDAAVLAVYGDVRVFVPIVAILGERATDGTDKTADMAAVFMTGSDGRKALLTFSSVEALQTWNPLARPVPVWGREAARAALDEGASALLLDLGSDHFAVLELSA